MSDKKNTPNGKKGLFNLIRRFGAIGTAQTRQKTGMAGIGEKTGMETVPPRTVGVPFQNRRLHVIVL